MTAGTDGFKPNDQEERIDISAEFADRFQNSRGQFVAMEITKERKGVVRGITLTKGTDFRTSDISGLRFENCKFMSCKLSNMNWPDIHRKAEFSECHFAETTIASNLKQMTFDSSEFVECSFGPAENATFTSSKFEGSRFPSDVVDWNLTNSRIDDCDFRSIRFIRCNLEGTSFGKVEMNGSTRFEDSTSTKRVSISRLQLAYLNAADTGGFTVGQRVDMNIRDDVGRLRRMFSGVQFWLHLIALIVFLLPYVLFVVSRLFEANVAELLWSEMLGSAVSETDVPGANNVSLSGAANFETITMGTALLNFFRTGGIDWVTGQNTSVISMTTGVLFLLYNVVRVMLWLKASSLAIEEQISGLPAKFYLSGFRDGLAMNGGFWSFCYHLHWSLFIAIGMASAALHSLQFLLLPVPIWH